MTQEEVSPWQAPSAAFRTTEAAAETPASDLPKEPDTVIDAMVTAQHIKIECEEEATVAKVIDADFANLIYTIAEEDEADLSKTGEETASAVVITMDLDDDDDMPTVEVSATVGMQTEQPTRPSLNSSGHSDESGEETACTDNIKWPPRILEGYPCPLLDGDPAISCGMRPAVASEPSLADLEMMAETEKLIPEIFQKSLAGSVREGTLCCLMDLTGVLPDRPAKMPQIARGQCRSLSKEPTRSSRNSLPEAVRTPRSFCPGHDEAEEGIKEEEKEAAPITHALFICDTEELPSAPLPMKEKIDPSNSGYVSFSISGTAIKKILKS